MNKSIAPKWMAALYARVSHDDDQSKVYKEMLL